jgi:hypothetical protein
MAFAPWNSETFQHSALLRLQQDEPQIDVMKYCLPMALFAAATMRRTSARPAGSLWLRYRNLTTSGGVMLEFCRMG